MAEFPTYRYEGENITALDGDHVITSGTEFSKVAETADEYFNSLRESHDRKSRKEATHVLTPNGERGTVLGHTKSLWADEITVRFDNGEIRHFDTFTANLKFSSEQEVPSNPFDYFQAKLDEMPDPTRTGLATRLNELDEVRSSIGNLITSGVTNSDAAKLHQLVMTAEAEKQEVQEALAHLEAADDAIEAPKMAYTAVEQGSVGPYANNDWLEIVAQEMADETENQDFGKLASEGPTIFVGELDDAVIAHAGTTRQMAEDYIQAKTAGFQGEEVDAFRDTFVADVEVARRRQASYRTQVARTAAIEKETSVADLPDEALFL